SIGRSAFRSCRIVMPSHTKPGGNPGEGYSPGSVSSRTRESAPRNTGALSIVRTSRCTLPLLTSHFFLRRRKNPLVHLIDFPHAVHLGHQSAGPVEVQHRLGFGAIDLQAIVDNLLGVVVAAAG